jgi:tetratricopeptide (TPR) repeat protein
MAAGYEGRGMAIEGAIGTAKHLYLQGRLAEAERLFREALRQSPNEASALEGLGVLVFQQGRTSEAASLFTQALAVERDSARLHANLGEALRLLGQSAKALEHLNRATALEPSMAQAWNSLGLLAHGRGLYAEAKSHFDEALRLRPKFVPAMINLGSSLLAMGQRGAAADAFKAALAHEPNNTLAMALLARSLCELGEAAGLDEAEALARRAVSLAPLQAHLLANLAIVLRARGKNAEAVACQRTIQELGNPATKRPIARSAQDQSANPARARDVATTPPTASPADAQLAQGLTHLKENRQDDAERCFHQALRLAPELAAAWIGLARVHEERGSFDEACRAARQALEVQPRQAEAYWRLAFILRGRLPDADVQAMQSLANDPEMSADARALLGFGLAAVLDPRGQYREAAAQLETANALQSASKASRGLSCDPDRFSTLIDNTIASFTPEFLAARLGWGVPDARPVFVVGLPRSGTTLTEQILASHAAVHGAGELSDVHQIFNELPELVGEPSSSPFAALSRLELDHALTAARRYIDRIGALAPARALRVVDKDPDNFNLLGLIALLWPNSRIILCSRDLRDIAVSYWQMGFLVTSWSNDWNHIARRLVDYQRILRHWQATRPIDWLEVRYRDVVTDLESQARRMIDFLGLEWNPACLEFHTNKRIVRTPSLVQVRQPVHSQSVGRWRNYEAFIQPMFEALKRHGVEPGADA